MEDHEENSRFDRKMRALLQALPAPAEPVTLPRRTFLRQGAGLTAAVAVLGMGGWLGWRRIQPPELIQAALQHVRDEADLRGILVPSLAPVRAALGLRDKQPFPGIVQLCKACQVGNRPVWHLTVFLDQLGYVQILAFQQALPPLPEQGRWFDHYWRVMPRRNLLLLARSNDALTRIRAELTQPGSSSA